MGHTHSLGLTKNYYKPTELEALEDYSNAVGLLSISEKNKLQKKLKSYLGLVQLSCCIIIYRNIILGRL